MIFRLRCLNLSTSPYPYLEYTKTCAAVSQDMPCLVIYHEKERALIRIFYMANNNYRLLDNQIKLQNKVKKKARLFH